MTLVRWSTREGFPAVGADILGMQQDIKGMFDTFFREGLEHDTDAAASAWNPPVDVAEQEDGYVVMMELPGVRREDVKITMRENVLTVTGEKKQEKESRASGRSRVERSYGAFQRSFSLPGSVRPDGGEASFADGVLSIRLRKPEEAKPRQIEVKVQ
ncbi:MAG: Hsp20/alpha crystallin family protein [Bacteroidota bacterium]